jgi:hypothetical protein
MQRNLCRGKLALVSFALLIFFIAAMSARGVLANGPGTPITPYPSHKEVSKEDVIQVKDMASKMRTVRDIRLKGENGHKLGQWQAVGLMYVEGHTARGEPFFFFGGATDSGNEVSIDFSEIESFHIIKIKKPLFRKDRALVQILRFPTISPKDLLARKPSYLELRQNYADTVSVWIHLEEEGGGKLCFVGQNMLSDSGTSTGGYEVITRVRDIEMVDLYQGLPRREALWWAISSVTEDEHYPHRVFMAK